MIATLISIITLISFLLWAVKYTGTPTSISSLFYSAKTRWTYTLVIGGIGVLMTLVDPYSLIHFAGISLVLGTAAPHFKDESSLSKPLHFGLTGLTVVLAITYSLNLWFGIIGLLLLGISKLLENRIKNSVFWTEVFLFGVVFLGVLIKNI